MGSAQPRTPAFSTDAGVRNHLSRRYGDAAPAGRSTTNPYGGTITWLPESLIGAIETSGAPAALSAVTSLVDVSVAADNENACVGATPVDGRLKLTVVGLALAETIATDHFELARKAAAVMPVFDVVAG